MDTRHTTRMRIQWHTDGTYAILKWRNATMDASAINRKLKELDALEKRLRQTVNPSMVLLKQIAEERQALLNPKEQK